MASEWFYRTPDHQEIGPFGSRELRRLVAEGTIRPDTRVRKADMAKWARAAVVQGLFSDQVLKEFEKQNPRRKKSPHHEPPHPLKPKLNPADSLALPFSTPAPKKKLGWFRIFARIAGVVAAFVITYFVARNFGYLVAHQLATESSDDHPRAVGIHVPLHPVDKHFATSDEYVLDALASKNAEVRAKALQSIDPDHLTSKQRENALSLARKTLASAEFANAFPAALQTLAALGYEADVPLVESVVDQPGVGIRGSTFAAVLKLDLKEGLRFYQSKAHPNDLFEIHDVIENLSHPLGNNTGPSPATVHIAAALLQSPATDLRRVGITLLANLGSPADLPALTTVLSTERNDVLAELEKDAINKIKTRPTTNPAPTTKPIQN